ncbi:MAG TPA: 50S ribosomal protein L15 [Planctomycetaceae bacterium]|nr:50S ribosomal protein L15 [Planctomycetaceae bacterium]
MRIDDVNKGINKRRRPMRIGRGNGSGKGKTSGRGQDGQKSRRGFSRHPGKVGEDLPMIRRIPKRGFNNRWASTVIALNVGDLAAVFEAGDDVSPKTLKERGIVKKRFDEIKILGDGAIDKALNVAAHRFSKSAEEKIAAAGGKVEKLKAKQTPAERVAAKAKK